MATLSLKISLNDGKVVKTMQFDPSTSVFDACKVIRDKILEANLGERKSYLKKKNKYFYYINYKF